MRVTFNIDKTYSNGPRIFHAKAGEIREVNDRLAQHYLKNCTCSEADAPFKVEAPTLTLENRQVDIETKELPAYETLLEDLFNWSKKALKFLNAEGFTVARIAAMKEGDDDYKFVIGLRGPNEKNIASIIEAAK